MECEKIFGQGVHSRWEVCGTCALLTLVQPLVRLQSDISSTLVKKKPQKRDLPKSFRRSRLRCTYRSHLYLGDVEVPKCVTKRVLILGDLPLPGRSFGRCHFSILKLTRCGFNKSISYFLMFSKYSYSKASRVDAFFPQDHSFQQFFASLNFVITRLDQYRVRPEKKTILIPLGVLAVS